MSDERNKVRYDKKANKPMEYKQGDLVLVKNRKPGVLEPYMVGPYKFVRYKDRDKYACILEDDYGKEFDCSVSHIVPLDGRNVKRKKV